MYEHGLTPPTTDIVGKRQARQEAAKSQSGTSNQLEGVEYWEMVEIQLAALLSKDKSAKPWRRHEFLEEPDVDPVVLEKVLRRNGHPEFKWYSGQDIDESEIDIVNPENEPLVRIPHEVLEELEPLAGREESDDAFEVVRREPSPPREAEPAPEPESEAEPQPEEVRRDEEEDESEDEDEHTRELSEAKKQLEILTATLAHYQRSKENTNSYIKGKRQAHEAELLVKIEALQQRIDQLRSTRTRQPPS
jgi:hypothetical protein